jgi:hypothetical protein
MVQDKNDPKHGQLSSLYLKWKESPNEYGNQMAETVDKIIFSTINRQSLHPIYRKIEDHDDLIQELRYLCFQRLNKINEPTNKRIFNYLRISIKLALKDKARKVGKRLDRESIEIDVLSEKVKPLDPLFYYNDTLLEQVATLLANGETKQNICSILSITRGKLDKEIDRLKVMYSDKK